MARRFSSLFFRQNSRDGVASAAAGEVHASASRPGVAFNPIQRTDLPQKTVRHVKSSGALLGTLRSLQYNIQPQPPVPTPSARGLGELQECFWLEDSLHRTTSQLDRCSDQLDQIQGSAAEVRQELKSLQVELDLLKTKMQRGEEGRESISELPKPVEITPERPTPAKASSIQQRIQFFSKIAGS